MTRSKIIKYKPDPPVRVVGLPLSMELDNYRFPEFKMREIVSKIGEMVEAYVSNMEKDARKRKEMDKKDRRSYRAICSLPEDFDAADIILRFYQEDYSPTDIMLEFTLDESEADFAERVAYYNEVLLPDYEKWVSGNKEFLEAEEARLEKQRQKEISDRLKYINKEKKRVAKSFEAEQKRLEKEAAKIQAMRDQ